jgi:hypothetical protein
MLGRQEISGFACRAKALAEKLPEPMAICD